MARFNDIVNSFSSGEVSPRLYGRTDSDLYKKGAKEVLNMYPTQQGGLRRRAGTQLILDNVELDEAIFCNATRIESLVISSTEKYLIIFDSYNATGTDGMTFYNADSKRAVGFILYGGVGNLPGINTDVFSTEEEVNKIKVSQVGDVLYCAHPNSVPFYIARISENNLATAAFYIPAHSIDFLLYPAPTIDRVRSFPMKDMNLTSITMQFAAATGDPINLTSSVAFFTTTAKMSGTVMAFQDAGVVGYAIIKTITSTTVAVTEIVSTIPGAFVAANSSTQWYIGAWSAGNYPRAVAGHKGALYFGGSSDENSKLWKSQDFDIYEFTNDRVLDPGATILDTDPIAHFLYSDSSNYIEWLLSHNTDLLVGSIKKRFAVRSMTGTSTPDIRPQSGGGSSFISAVVLGDLPIFVDAGGKKVASMDFDFNINGYKSTELSILAEHLSRQSLISGGAILTPTIKQIAAQSYPTGTIWVVDSNGYLYASTIEAQGKLKAWYKVEIAGVSGLLNYARILSIAVLPSATGEEALYILVERTINSTKRIYIEVIDNEFSYPTLASTLEIKETHPIYCDSSRLLNTMSNVSFWASFTNDAQPEISESGVPGIIAGAFDFSNHWLELATAGRVNFTGTAFVDEVDGVKGTFGITLYNPNGFGVGANRTIFATSTAPSFSNNLIELYITGKVIFLHIRDSSGGLISNAAMYDFTDTFGFDTDKVHLQLGYLVDGSGAEFYLFTNGSLVANTSLSTYTRTTELGQLVVGASYNTLNPLGQYTHVANMYYKGGSLENIVTFVNYPFQARISLLANLHYLEGEEVTVLGDGKFIGKFTVSSRGTITLPNDDLYAKIVIGLPYTHRLESLPVEFGASVGTAQGEIKRIDKVIARFQDTVACEFGPAIGKTEDILFRDETIPLDTPIPLYTGDKVLEFDGDYDRNATVVLTGDAPLPCNITCLVYKGITYG